MRCWFLFQQQDPEHRFVARLPEDRSFYKVINFSESERGSCDTGEGVLGKTVGNHANSFRYVPLTEEFFRGGGNLTVITNRGLLSSGTCFCCCKLMRYVIAAPNLCDTAGFPRAARGRPLKDCFFCLFSRVNFAPLVSPFPLQDRILNEMLRGQTWANHKPVKWW